MFFLADSVDAPVDNNTPYTIVKSKCEVVNK